MPRFDKFDPWSESKTVNGLPSDQVVSMLQKAIRKGLEKDAIDAAYEMYSTCVELEAKMWTRLLIISLEDVGFGDTFAPVFVYTCSQIRFNYDYEDGDRALVFIHAIRYLCRCKKERSSSYYQNIVEAKAKNGYVLTIPDYAIDMHTKKGQEMGVNSMQFYSEGDHVTPEYNDEESLHTKALREEAIRLAKESLSKHNT